MTENLIEYVKFRPSKDQTADDVRQDWAEVNYIITTFEKMFEGKTAVYKIAPWYLRLLGYKWLSRKLCCDNFRRATVQESEMAESFLQTLAYHKEVRDDLFNYVDAKPSESSFAGIVDEDIDDTDGIVDRRIKGGGITENG